MQSFMIALLTCSVSMSALALLYMMTNKPLAKRYSEKGRYYVWLVIVIGLIIPFRPHFNRAIIHVNVPSQVAMPIQTGGGMPVAMRLNTALPPALPSISWWQVAAVVWMAGAIVFLAHHGIKHMRFMKIARRWSENIADDGILALLQQLKAELGVSQQPGLYTCPGIGGPMMIGFLKPRILLPKADFNPDELRFILKHELVHYKRMDLWYKLLVLIATAMHWFNPIVYLMARAIGAQCEISCDAETVRRENVRTRRYYGETIIHVVKYQSKLKTALSTNFYGGKKGMKKRIFSIMDARRKKAGFAIICGALIITLGTGLAFAANTNTVYASSIPAPVEARKYAGYEEYGLAYDKTADTLYFNGELVRYFEDWYPVGDNARAGIDHFDESGTIDVHGVRDFSQIVQNFDGSSDPSGKLVGVEPYSRAEFDARDIEELKPTRNAVTVRDGAYQRNERGDGGSVSDFVFSGESREAFERYAEFGLTYDDDNVFRYYGKTVRRFADSGGGLGFTRSVENDYDKSVDLTAIRDAGGKLAGLAQANREEFVNRTARIKQAQREYEEFQKSHPNVTAYSVIENDHIIADDETASAAREAMNVTTNSAIEFDHIIADDETASAAREATNVITYSAIETDRNPINADTASADAREAPTVSLEYSNAYDAASINPDYNYVDTILNDYLAYGISYDELATSWMFNGKPVSFLADRGHQLYVNIPYDNTTVIFAEQVEASNGAFLKVVRNPDDSVDRIVEMTTSETVKEINDIFH